MKKKLLYLLLTLCTAFALFAFVGCKDDKENQAPLNQSELNKETHTPVYQGMSIAKNTAATTMNAAVARRHTNAQEDFEQENDESLETDIENILQIEVAGDKTTKYYVQPNEIFTVQIHIDNPNDYEIQSFTLNGSKYASYMFKDNSTMELLLLDVTAPSTAGYLELTIDAIKYIDGTEIKDVRLDGDKTIKAGVAFTKAPTANLSNVVLATTSLSFTAQITDTQNVINGNAIKAYLSNGNEIVAERKIEVGVNHVTFDDLLIGTTYEIGICTSYDYIDGYGVKAHWLLTQTVSTQKAFMITEATTTKERIDFVIEKLGYVGNLTKIELIDGATNATVKTLADTTLRSFDSLLSNHPYKIALHFAYENNGAQVNDTSVISFMTKAKTVPTVTLNNLTSTQTSVGFEIATTDADDILSIDKIELYKDSSLVKTAESVTAREFTELLSNNEYTVRVGYSYDLNDGAGKQIKFVQSNKKTIAKTAPTLAVTEDNVTDTTLSGTLNVTDIDDICTINSVKLYKGATEFATNAQNKVAFGGLDYYTDYTVAVSYSYDLNDGVGVQTKEYTKEYKTAPHLMFNSCNIINTSAVSEGDTIYMQVSLDNPSGTLPQSVIVNGQSYNCTGSTTATKIYVEIVNNGQFAGGDTILTIEQVNMVLGGKTYSVLADENNQDNVFINGKLEVVSLDLVNAVGEIVDYCFPDDEMYLLLTLNNKTGYDIDSIKLSHGYYNNAETITNLIKIDNEHYKIAQTIDYGWNDYSLSEISYSNSYINKSLGVNKEVSVYKVKTSTVTEISSVFDLMNTTYDGGYYKLTADIDLSGIEWTNLGNFEGVFNGNGYSIKNMSNVSTITDKQAYIGLFYGITGVVCNVSVEDMIILITLMSTDDTTYGANIGGIASHGHGHIVNCSVSGDITVTNNTVYSGGTANSIGGLISSAGDVNVINCYTNVNIMAMGGAGNYIGGIAGTAHSSSNTAIINCYSTGNIAIIGKGTSNYVGGLVGSIGNATSIINCYKCFEEKITHSYNGLEYHIISGTKYGTAVELLKLQSVEFQTTVLGWSTDDWIFVEGQHPTLKQQN